MTSDPIVITGAALITCLGLTKEDTWRAVLTGRCGIGPMPALESPPPDSRGGGQALDLPSDYFPDLPRESRYLRRAIFDALSDANISDLLPYPPHRCGIVLGTTLHGMREAGQFLRTEDLSHLADFSPNAVLARATAGLPFAGIAATTCSACSSSLGAIALASTLLHSGQLDLVLAGGYDPISEYAYGGFNSLRLIAHGPLRPFAKDRQGMKLAEGYAILILERAPDASRRSAKPIAQIIGYGESADAHHLTQPHPQGNGAHRAIAAAFASASIKPADIDLIAAHATATPDNDAGEFAAFQQSFGDHLSRIPVVAFKSHLGHTLGGAGASELILSALAIRDQLLPACVNVTQADVEFPGLNLSTGSSHPHPIRATLNTSLGFGGANTCVILRKPDVSSPVTISIPSPREVFITGVGIVLPDAIGNDAFAQKIRSSSSPAWLADPGPIPNDRLLHLLSARRVRRMSDYVKATLAAAALACQDANFNPPDPSCPVILGSTHGSANYCKQYYSDIVHQGLIAANPMLFAEGVPNAAAAHLSLMFSLQGPCQTIIGSRTAGLDALRLASLRIASGQWDRAIVGAAEEYCPTVNQAYRHCALYAGRDGSPPFAGDKGFVSSSAAVAFILESRSSFEHRNARPRGIIQSASSARAPIPNIIPAAIDLLSSLGDSPAILSSANGTWIDRAELAAIQRSRIPLLSAIYGHIAECCSATPLIAAAVPLLTGRFPSLLGDAPIASSHLHPAAGDEPISSFISLCTDYTGLISAVHIALCPL